MIYELPFPDLYRPERDDAGVIHAYLKEHGVEVYGVSVTNVGITVESDTDPTSVLLTFTPEPTERERLLAQLDAINLETATTAKLREAVTILKQLVT